MPTVPLKHFSKRISNLLIAFLSVHAPAYAGVLPFFDPLERMENNSSFCANANTFLTNDPFVLKDLLLNGLKTDSPHIKNGTNIALGSVRADIGYKSEKFGYIGYVYKEEVYIKTNGDTVELLYLATNKKEFPLGKTYKLELSIKAFEVQGITYSNSLELLKKGSWFFKVGYGVEVLQGKDMQNGTVYGNARAEGMKTYSFDAVANYNYTHNYLYKLDVQSAEAYGYSTHFSLYLKKDKFDFLFLVNDFFGRLYWKGLPLSEVRLSSNSKVYDKDGYISYKPTAWGYEGYEDIVQKLSKKYRTQFGYTYGRYLFRGGSDYIYGIYMPYFEGTYRVSQSLDFALGYETRFHSFSLFSRYENFDFGIRVDNLLKPSTLGLHIVYKF